MADTDPTDGGMIGTQLPDQDAKFTLQDSPEPEVGIVQSIEHLDNTHQEQQEHEVGRDDYYSGHEELDSLPNGPITMTEELGHTTPMEIQGQEQEPDDDSLFIPEERTPVPSARPVVARTPPRPAPLPASTYRKIESLRKKMQQKKPTLKRFQGDYQPIPDNEACLEAGSRPPAGQPSARAAINVGDFGEEDRIATEKFQKHKSHYEAIMKGRPLNTREDIEWLRIQRGERTRQAKKQRNLRIAREEAEEMDLFPTIHNSEDSRENKLDDGTCGIQPGSSRKRRKPEMPLKEPKAVSMAEAELESMRVALEADKDLPQKKKQKGYVDSTESLSPRQPRGRGRPKGSSSRAIGAATRGAAKITSKRSRKTVKDRQEAQRALRQATSLFSSNVFQRQAPIDAPEEPTFTSTRRVDAFKELLASVPIENLGTAKNDKAALLSAVKAFDGHGSVKADRNSMWLVKGMRTSLKNYQIMGTAFMRNRENATEEPRGGLMADQMGLGKTLMMLANIVNGHPGKNHKCKTTLLVASPALLTQWARETDLHTNGSLSCMRYSCGTRIDSNRPWEILQSQDIIFTTYQEVMKSYPKNEPPIECQTAEQKMAWWEEVYKTERGVLHRMLFHRVVLDEAQAIKNHQSRTSIACRALMAKHRWALSGTPITNSLSELYPYFKFLGVPHTGNYRIFKHNYTDGGNPENTERLLLRLASFMIRRTHGDEMFGAPILKLPQAAQGTWYCDFNAIERSVYDIVRQRFAERISAMAKKEGPNKGYANALVMLLRLRQLSGHILMLQFVMRDLLEREDIECIRNIVDNTAADATSIRGRQILTIREQLKKHASDAKCKSNNGKHVVTDDEDNSDEGSDLDDEGDPRASGKKFGKDYNFKPFLNSLTTGPSWERAKKEAKCHSCQRSPEWITSCGHLLCGACYEKVNTKAAEAGKSQATCPCSNVFSSIRELEDGETGSLEYRGPETRGRSKRQDKQHQKIEMQDIDNNWLSFGDKGLLPSAKTIAVKAQVLNWVKENQDVKIIIYTQFLAMIRILAKMCQEEGWKTEEYHGKLSQTARDKAIRHFADNANIRVLLASLRCGGLGLNLTMASRVIVIDPWWNESVEQQAFCRVYRFGQNEKTFLTKLCVKGTVDERLIAMQERKQQEINSVMEDKGDKVKNMTIKDLMRLFGNMQDDEDVKPFIMVDNPDPRGGFMANHDDEGYADEL